MARPVVVAPPPPADRISIEKPLLDSRGFVQPAFIRGPPGGDGGLQTARVGRTTDKRLNVRRQLREYVVDAKAWQEP
jgi:hypothetical protein